jgi:hypothetical protein
MHQTDSNLKLVICPEKTSHIFSPPKKAGLSTSNTVLLTTLITGVCFSSPAAISAIHREVFVMPGNLSGGDVQAGRTSWFGQYGFGKHVDGLHKHVWRDPDKPANRVPASGLPQTVPGIALPSPKTLKHWYEVELKGKRYKVQQTDIMPDQRKGRKIDINAPLADMVGWTPDDFPTDSIVRFRYLGKELPLSQPELSLGGSETKSEKKQGEIAPRKTGIDRSMFAKELEDDKVLIRLYALTLAEVGAEHEDAQTALMETIFNRAFYRKTSLWEQMQANYYEPLQTGSFQRNGMGRLNKTTRAKLAKVLERVKAGSNVSNFAVHNSSAHVAANAKRNHGWYKTIGGETFSTKIGAPGDPDETDIIKRLPRIEVAELPKLAMLEAGPDMKERSLTAGIPRQESMDELSIGLPPPVLSKKTLKDMSPKIHGKVPHGMHPVIKASMTEASKMLPEGYSVRFDNAARTSSSIGGRSYHLQWDRHGALAVDIEIRGPKGPLRNIASPKNFAMYRDFMHWTKKIQYELFPDYRGKGRWGGYFTAGVSQDLMHYDLGPERGTMAGNWEVGLKKQWRHFGLPGDVGKGMGSLAGFKLPMPIPPDMRTASIDFVRAGRPGRHSRR